MKLCEVCHKAFPDDATVCPEHGERLAPDALIGTTLGDYRVLDCIREGGTAVLYSAAHVVTKQPVAVKVIKASLAHDENFANRFEREARAVLRIGHPHLIKVLFIGKTPDGRVYYVRELLDGRSLATVMASTRLPMRVFAPMMLDVMDAVAAAHAAGILHGDLKPEHVFLVEKPGKPPFAKVLDFGYAAVPEAQADAGAAGGGVAHAGSPRYVAPEVLDGAVVDQRADVYALGVMLYELSTGRAPFVAETAEKMREELRTQSPPLLDGMRKHLAEGVPIEIEAVIFKALAREPADRYRNVRSIRSDLQRVIDGEVPDASPWWSLERQTKYAGRRMSSLDMPALRPGPEAEALAREVTPTPKPRSKVDEVGLDTIRPVLETPQPTDKPPTTESTFIVQAEDATGAHAAMMASLQAAALEVANNAALAPSAGASALSGRASALSGRASAPSGGASAPSGGASAPSGGAAAPSAGASAPSDGASPSAAGAPVPTADPNPPSIGRLTPAPMATQSDVPTTVEQETSDDAGLTTLPPMSEPAQSIPRGVSSPAPAVPSAFTAPPAAVAVPAFTVPAPVAPVSAARAAVAPPVAVAPSPTVSDDAAATIAPEPQTPLPSVRMVRGPAPLVVPPEVAPVQVSPPPKAKPPIGSIVAVLAAALVSALVWWFTRAH